MVDKVFVHVRLDAKSGQNLDNLLNVAGEVGKAVSTLVNIMTDDEESDDARCDRLEPHAFR